MNKKATPELSRRLLREMPKNLAADMIEDEVNKAETRLKVMYEQRTKALQSLEPDGTILIKQPQCTKYIVTSKDLFGVVYTDLFADHVKYWAKQPSREWVKCSEEGRSPIGGPLPENLRSSQWLSKNVMSDHWCVCRRPEDGKEMIECGNEKCLVGWYHVDCVGVHVEEDGTCASSSLFNNQR